MEKWLPVVGYEGAYEVSNLGGVRSLDRTVWQPNRGKNIRLKGRVLKPALNNHGYPFVQLCSGSRDAQKQAYVHHLVAAAFIGPRPVGHEVCHRDNDPGNPAEINLRYDTHQGNHLDRIEHGTHTRGEDNGGAKLTAAKVLEIRSKMGSTSYNQIAKLFGVSAALVGMIDRRERWAWL